MTRPSDTSVLRARRGAPAAAVSPPALWAFSARHSTPARALALVCLLTTAWVGLASCGKSSNGSPAASAATVNGLETGPALKAVRVPGTVAAVVALFADGRAFYSPDGFNQGGGGNTIPAYDGALQVLDIVAVGAGVDALFSNGTVYFSPDGQHLGGGGRSAAAYAGEQQVASLAAVGTGVDAVFANGGPVYWSADGLNLGGGGHTTRVYAGGNGVQQIVPVGPGDAVVTLFDGGTAMYSPDNRDIGGGGGNTVAAASQPVEKLVKVGGGVLAQFSSGAVYLSPDGLNLDGGGATISVPAWNATVGKAPFSPRDSAPGSVFLGRLWLSGGYSYPTNNNSCFLTCSYFDLWSSTDSQGASWNSSPTFVTASTPNPRDQTSVVNDGVQDAPAPSDFYDSYSPLVVWNNQLTAMGSTVWRSADGVHWQRNNLSDGVTPAPGPLTRTATENSRAEILGGTLYFLQPDAGEVYASSDANAATWTDLGSIAGFTPRCGARSFTLAGKIWITAGGGCDYSAAYNDLWSSPDGVNWTQSTTPAQWSARLWPCVATAGDGIIWLVGGYAPTDWNSDGQTLTRRYSANHADVWYTRNGTDWRQLKADAGSGLPDDGMLPPRHAPTCYITANGSAQTLVVVAGTGGPNPDAGQAEPLNDIVMLPLPPAASLP